MCVLLDRRLHDVETGTVVPEMDDFGAGSLQDPTENVDRGVVTVEQRGRGDETDPVLGAGLILP